MSQAAAIGAAAPNTKVRLAAVAWVLTSIYYFYQYSLRSAPAVMMPELSNAFGMSPLGVASIIGLFYYGYSPFSLVAGAAMDRFGPRRFLPGAAAVVGIGALLFATGNSQIAMAGRFIQGAGGVFALVGAIYIATKNFPPSRAATLIGATQMFGMAGGSVPIGTVAALGVGSVSAFASYYHGDRAVLAATSARPIEEVAAGAGDADKLKLRQLENIVDEMAIAAGLPRPRVYVVPDADPNAFATGRGPERSSIAVTRGLLDTLDREELQGVVAHELSHVRNLDIRVMTIVAALVGGASCSSGPLTARPVLFIISGIVCVRCQPSRPSVLPSGSTDCDNDSSVNPARTLCVHCISCFHMSMNFSTDVNIAQFSPD